MLFDSINLVEGSSVKNLKVDSGSLFPDSPNTGELFFRTDESKLYAYNGTEWIASGSGSGVGGLSSSLPKITAIQVSTSTFQPSEETAIETNAIGYIKISGTGFVAGCNVIIGETNAVSTQFVDAQTLNVTTPALDEGNYNVYVMNPDGGTAVRVNGVSFSNLPAWQTAATLPSIFENGSVSIQLSATDAVSYSLQSGSSLPSGLSLNSSGLISGTAPSIASLTTYTFTVVAIDAQNQESTRTFSLTVDKQFAATGGTITTSGNFKIHTFTSNGTFAVTSAPPGSTVQVMVVGGGGGGGAGDRWDGAGGGGGGGGFLYNSSFAVTSGQNISVTVGGGGGPAGNGGNSQFGSLTAIGGGAGGTGGNFSGTTGTNAASGGSGGGGRGVPSTDSSAAAAALRAGGAGTAGQGNSGGSTARGYSRGAGGGGAGGAGGNVVATSEPGATGTPGGAGRAGLIPGTTGTIYAAGGGGSDKLSTGVWGHGAGGTVGAGIGAGRPPGGANSGATSGMNGRGHGGGGGGSGSTSGSVTGGGGGGSGVVVVAYQFQ